MRTDLALALLTVILFALGANMLTVQPDQDQTVFFTGIGCWVVGIILLTSLSWRTPA